MKKNQNGVTLIALVITIIVLLILAGVSIAMLSGENGILTNATKSAAASAIADAKSAIATKIANLTTEYYNAYYVESAGNAGNLAANLQAQGTTIASEAAAASNNSVDVTYDTSTKKFTIKYKKNPTVYSSVSSAVGTGQYMTWTDTGI